MTAAKTLIDKLSLTPHPEGGFYKEIYRDKCLVTASNLVGSQNASTAIYYLLLGDAFSAFHRLKSDKAWHYYEGNSALFVYEFTHTGQLKIHKLGNSSQAVQYFSVITAGSCGIQDLKNPMDPAVKPRDDINFFMPHKAFRSFCKIQNEPMENFQVCVCKKAQGELCRYVVFQ